MVVFFLARHSLELASSGSFLFGQSYLRVRDKNKFFQYDHTSLDICHRGRIRLKFRVLSE